ncbi:hypothetical protein CC78DRAFT_604793, partial [Lojkania enalia]
STNVYQLVNKSSAALDMVPQPLLLSRPHILMNKFAYNKYIDFRRMSGKIIRTKYYTADRLKIERLSGNLLLLERCYINLAIVEEPRKNTRHVEEGSVEDALSYASPFLLTARLKVETLDKNIQVELASLFDPRKDSNSQTIKPRRILIWGSARVRKTTLYKKMVDKFACCSEDFRK